MPKYIQNPGCLNASLFNKFTFLAKTGMHHRKAQQNRAQLGLPGLARLDSVLQTPTFASFLKHSSDSGETEALGKVRDLLAPGRAQKTPSCINQVKLLPMH